MSQQKLERLESDSIGTKSVPRDAYYVYPRNESLATSLLR